MRGLYFESMSRLQYFEPSINLIKLRAEKANKSYGGAGGSQSVGARSNPHVLTNLYTTPNTSTLTRTSTRVVVTLAKALSPDSPVSGGRTLCPGAALPRLPARPRARAGNAKLCVKVNLCSDSDKEYGPTLPLAAALSKAYSKSSASNSEYLAVMVELLRLWSCCGQLSWWRVGAATEVIDELVEEVGDRSRSSSAEVCAVCRRSRAWSGCSSAQEGRRAPTGLLRMPPPPMLAAPPGEGEACQKKPQSF